MNRFLSRFYIFFDPLEHGTRPANQNERAKKCWHRSFWLFRFGSTFFFPSLSHCVMCLCKNIDRPFRAADSVLVFFSDRSPSLLLDLCVRFFHTFLLCYLQWIKRREEKKAHNGREHFWKWEDIFFCIHRRRQQRRHCVCGWISFCQWIASIQAYFPISLSFNSVTGTSVTRAINAYVTHSNRIYHFGPLFASPSLSLSSYLFFSAKCARIFRNRVFVI